MKTLFPKVWLRRATVLCLALAVTLALVVGAASPVLAKKKKRRPPQGVVPVLVLNVQNAVSAVSSLVGSVDGPLLRLDNDGAGANSTGLDVQVESGKAPITVNPEAGKATNLDADKLDGQDSTAFVPARIYAVENTGTGTGGANANSGIVAECDSGDKLVGGGFGSVDAGTVLRESDGDFNGQQWSVNWTNDATADSVRAEAYCADFPPLRP